MHCKCIQRQTQDVSKFLYSVYGLLFSVQNAFQVNKNDHFHQLAESVRQQRRATN